MRPSGQSGRNASSKLSRCVDTEIQVRSRWSRSTKFTSPRFWPSKRSKTDSVVPDLDICSRRFVPILAIKNPPSDANANPFGQEGAEPAAPCWRSKVWPSGPIRVKPPRESDTQSTSAHSGSTHSGRRRLLPTNRRSSRVTRKSRRVTASNSVQSHRAQGDLRIWVRLACGCRNCSGANNSDIICLVSVAIARTDKNRFRA